MTESDYLNCADPKRFLSYLADCPRDGPIRLGGPTTPLISNRKLRLFACACARAVYAPVHPDQEMAIAAAEFTADNETEGWYGRLLDARRSIDAVDGWIWCATCPDIGVGIRQTVCHESLPAPAVQAAILREIAGNPFRPHEGLCGRVWAPPDAGAPHRNCRDCRPFLTPTVLQLAGSACTDRLPDGALDPLTLMAMADALEEAGLSEDLGGSMLTPSILLHLRSPRPHYRGCWATDTILGKEQ